MPDTPSHLSDRMRSEGEKALAAFDALAPEHWSQTIYTDGACWTVKQVLAHFVNAELSFGKLIENVAGGGSGAPEDFDINAYNEKNVGEMGGLSTAEMLAQFQALRKANADFVLGLSPEALERQGRHPFLGVVPLGEMIKLIYRHNQLHLRDLRRIISPEA